MQLKKFKEPENQIIVRVSYLKTEPFNVCVSGDSLLLRSRLYFFYLHPVVFLLNPLRLSRSLMEAVFGGKDFYCKINEVAQRIHYILMGYWAFLTGWIIS